MRGGAAGGVCFLVLALGVLLTHRGVEGQDGLTYQRGQTVSPSYEGWQRNPDGSFNLLFGYMNRNWEERLEIPVGLDNSFSPGPADRGQPSYFLPRYTRMVFKVQVPPDFGDQELVWTLRTQGETKRAYGSLHRDYYLDDQTYQAQRGVYGGGGFREGAAENQPPIAELEGDRVRNVRVGEPLTLVAHVSDGRISGAGQQYVARHRGWRAGPGEGVGNKAHQPHHAHALCPDPLLVRLPGQRRRGDLRSRPGEDVVGYEAPSSPGGRCFGSRRRSRRTGLG